MTVIRDDIKDPMLRTGAGGSLVYKTKVFSVSSALIRGQCFVNAYTTAPLFSCRVSWRYRQILATAPFAVLTGIHRFSLSLHRYLSLRFLYVRPVRTD